VNSSKEVNNRILKFNLIISIIVLQLAGVSSLSAVLTCLKQTSISVNNSLFPLVLMYSKGKINI
jgi:hypothetical protein